jgi:hypothetical protein
MDSIMDDDPNMNGELDEDGDPIWTNTLGQYHRLDGPAIMYIDKKDGDDEYYLFGKDMLNKENYIKALKEILVADQNLIKRTILELS